VLEGFYLKFKTSFKYKSDNLNIYRKQVGLSQKSQRDRDLSLEWAKSGMVGEIYVG
jgi:hypothetical protein